MHNVTIRKNGKAEMAYTGEKPWHGYGEELQPGAGVDTWLTAAGMDWRVLRGKVRFATERSEDGSGIREWSDHHVLFRSDTKAPLGLVSEHFKVVQPREVLEFFRDLAANNRYSLETAGTLRGGSIYWALARINGERTILDGNDAVRGYVLLSTACDGTRKTSAKFTSVRVVCNNTLDMADRDGGKEVSVSHRSQFSADDVKRDLGLFANTFDEFVDLAKKLASQPLAQAQAEKATACLLKSGSSWDAWEARSDDERGELLKAAREDRHFQAIMDRFSRGTGQDLKGARGTAWGWVNGVTEYVDHAFPSRSQGNRLVSAWFGTNKRLKDDALRLASALV